MCRNLLFIFFRFAWLQFMLHWWLHRCLQRGAGPTGPPGCAFLFVSVSLFPVSDQLLHMSCTYWFYCGAAVSPAAFCLSRLQFLRSKRRRRWRRGVVDRHRELGGRERSGDRLREKSRISYLLGSTDSCIFKASCRYLLCSYSRF